MPYPSELLREIASALDTFHTMGDVTPQQATFIAHLEKTAQQLQQVINPIPETERALRYILPTFGDAILQKQVALFGYARLLLESPESFDGATLNSAQQNVMKAIYQHGQALHDLTQQIHQEATTERIKHHRTQPIPIHLRDFIDEQAPILTYWVHDKPIQLTITNTCDATLLAEPYHLSALLQHIIKVISGELIEYGQIRLSTIADGQQVSVNVFATGLTLNKTEMERLFVKEGRYMYQQRFTKNGGTILTEPIAGQGVSINLVLPQTHTI